jgi:hypothetical protein
MEAMPVVIAARADGAETLDESVGAERFGNQNATSMAHAPSLC